MLSFHQKYEPEIHIASIPVRGMVKDNAKVTSAIAIANQFYRLFDQKKGTKGEASVEMDDPDYDQGVAEMGKALESS